MLTTAYVVIVHIPWSIQQNKLNNPREINDPLSIHGIKKIQ
jgi:hypothetical protein